MSVNGYDVELEAEHRELVDLERDREARVREAIQREEREAWAGVHCDRGCDGPEPCEHVAHLVAGLRKIKEDR
jgi:hypothetical protein